MFYAHDRIAVKRATATASDLLPPTERDLDKYNYLASRVYNPSLTREDYDKGFLTPTKVKPEQEVVVTPRGSDGSL